MAGKISKQVKSDRPFLVNGVWHHRMFDQRPLSKRQLARMAEIAVKLQLRSA